MVNDRHIQEVHVDRVIRQETQLFAARARDLARGEEQVAQRRASSSQKVADRRARSFHLVLFTHPF